MFKQLFSALVCLFCAASVFVRAQTVCAPPQIVANANAANMFSPEQEMIFGDLTFERMAGDVRIVRDEALLAYVNQMGEKLVKHLPATGLKYQFHIMDIPEANAFNIPGGHVFLSRKLISFVNNEDELAGVMAHELGHAVVRHGAVDMSAAMRKVLGVTQLGDRKDIQNKYNLLIENARTKPVARRAGHEDAQQLEADKIGLFAMAAAGYAPAAFTSFFDRLTENAGKTGSWFSDLFGNTRPEQKRVREMINATEQLPATCREGREARQTENFAKWQADVVLFRNYNRKEELPGLMWKKELLPKLRSDVSHLVFSSDGKYLIAQDDFAVTVIEREPLQVLFQIPAEDADNASFTPDNKAVVFTTESLRFERWNIIEKKAEEVREMVLRRDCWEHKLSPDGKFLACVDTSTNINLIDTKTGKRVWQREKFYPLSYFEFISWITRDRDRDRDDDAGFFRIQFSPDSKFAVFSRSDRFRFRFSINGMTADSSENTAFALDLSSLKRIDVDGDLKKVAARPFIFLDSNRILGMPSGKVGDAGVFSFPNGKRQQKFEFSAQEIKPTLNQDYVVVKPLANIMMGIFDVKNARVATGINKADATIWNNVMAFESAAGKILLREIKYNEADKRFDSADIGTVEIPVGSLKNLNAASVSGNFKWLLMSSKTRGGTWNLETGERKVFVRGFRGAMVADDGGGIGAFPKFADTPHSLVLMNANNNQVAPIRALPEKGARQHGRFVLLKRSLSDKELDNQKNQPPVLDNGEYARETDLRQAVKFEVKDIISDKVLWTRDFPKETTRYSFDEYSGRLIFYYNLSSEIGKLKLKETPELISKAQALGNKDSDYLVEVVDAFEQKTAGSFLLETGNGSFFVGSGLSEKDWVMLYDSTGRVLVYSLKDGALRHRFFGKYAALNPKGSQVAIENFPGEVALYNLETGDLETKFVIGGSAAFVRFNLEGSKLFVLSDAQTAYAFDLGKIVSKRQREFF